jgi:hypothetical protein
VADVYIQVSGLAEAQKALYSYSNELGTKVTKSALHNAGTLFLKQARSNAPVLKIPTSHRIVGALKKQIYLKDSKWYNGKRFPIVRVFVDVHRGKKYGLMDAYYAKFIEYGWETHGSKRTAENTPGRYNRRGKFMLSRSKTGGRASMSGRQNVLGVYFMRNAFYAQVNNAIGVFKNNLFAGAELVKQKVGLN